MAVQSGFFWDETFLCSSSASLVNSQFLAVSLTTALGTGGLATNPAGQLPLVVLCASATNGVNGAVGILQNDPKVSQGAIVRLLGTSKMVATTSAAVTMSALVTTNALGQAMVADTTGQRVIGQVCAPSTSLSVGAVCEVMMFPRPIFFA